MDSVVSELSHTAATCGNFLLDLYRNNKEGLTLKKLYSTVITLVFLALFIPAAVQAAARHFPSWDKKVTGSGRFTVLPQFGGAAVFDKETGLVWEQSPDASSFDWLNAQNHCNELTVGSRLGWRLPTIQELASLVDPNAAGAPFLPAGHPFSNINAQGAAYWSATTSAGDTSRAWAVNFTNADVFNDSKIGGKIVWCVRGGQGVDPQ
jgi:hypothetical protein